MAAGAAGAAIAGVAGAAGALPICTDSKSFSVISSPLSIAFTFRLTLSPFFSSPITTQLRLLPSICTVTMRLPAASIFAMVVGVSAAGAAAEAIGAAGAAGAMAAGTTGAVGAAGAGAAGAAVTLVVAGAAGTGMIF